MKLQINKIEEMKSNLIICYKFEDKKDSKVLQYLNKLSKKQIDKSVKAGIISSKFSEITKIAINENLKAVVVGLGKYKDLTRKKFSIATASAARAVKSLKEKNIAIEAIEKTDKTKDITFNFDKADGVSIAICAFNIGQYKFDKFLTTKNTKISAIEIITQDKFEEIKKLGNMALHTAEAMSFTKDLVLEPAQNATPQYICEIAQEVAKENKLQIKVYNKNQIKKLKMNAFLAVGQGSVNEPKLIHLTYKPAKKPRRKIALVGKGITFDAGGMNIKPATSMLNMKDDMTGAATVLGIIQAVAKMKADIELHIVSALCENMTSGSAYKQGDVLTAMNGKTIEVDNTDAEGRITLADALSYCDKLNVDEVIDIATLTGAVIVSLGNNITGVMGNNQKQIDKFILSSKKSCENVWQMPIFEELKDNLKSEIADFKNTGGRNAGTSTAAWFLSNFTQSNSWMHLDIAGTAFLDKSNKETLSGPTGVMIRSLISYLIA